MKMYQSMKSISVLMFALFFAGAVSAQSETVPSKRDKVAGKEIKSKNKSESMEQELQLSPEQKAQFKKTDDDFKVKSKSVKNAKKEDMARLHEERKRAHKSVLNAEQSAKYDEIMKRREAKKAQKAYKHPKKTHKERKEQEKPEKH